MPLTKSDLKQINESIAAGNIEAARRLIRDSRDPRGPEMLAKIDARFPPSAQPAAIKPAPMRRTTTNLESVPPARAATKPALTPVIDPLDAVRGLIATGKYDEAEALLWTLETTPESEDLLKKLRLVQANGIKSGAVAKPARTSGKPVNYRALGLLVAVIATPIILLFAIPAIQGYINRIPNRLESICRSRFFDDYIDGDFTYDEMYLGCHYIALDIMKSNNDEANYCFNTFGETDKRFSDCLDEQNVYFYRPFILQARYNPELLPVPGNFPTPDLR